MSKHKEKYFQNGFTQSTQVNIDVTRLSKKMKRFRSAFTTDQINYLEREFMKFPYIGNVHRKEVAAILNIPERAVKIWFQNRRMKEKKDSSGKEFDENQICLKAVEIPVNQFKNINMGRSTNDNEARSLPIIVSANSIDPKSPTMNNDKLLPNNITMPSIKANYYKESLYFQNKISESDVEDKINSTLRKKRSQDSEYKATAEFSIDLCKKYKKELLHNCIKVQENVSEKKGEVQNEVLINNNISKNVPEDLTSNKNLRLPPSEQGPARNTVSNNTEYISVLPNYYPQRYIPTGGVFWNPINVVPVIPTVTSAVSTSNDPAGQEHIVQRVNCTCDCHRQFLPLALQQNPASSRYIITAVPFQSHTTKC